jgi:hypothetical protein
MAPGITRRLRWWVISGRTDGVRYSVVCYGELFCWSGSERATQKPAQDGALRMRPQAQVSEKATDFTGRETLQIADFVVTVFWQILAVRSRDGDYF